MRATLIGIVTVLLVGVSGPALGQARRMTDARDDAQVVSYDSMYTSHVQTAAPGPRGDIYRSRVRHRHGRVVIEVRFRKLPKPELFDGVVLLLEGDNGVTRKIIVSTTSAHPEGEVTCYRPDGTQISCPVFHRVFYHQGRVRVGVPRTLLRRPARVRAAGFWYHTAFVDSQPTQLFDDLAVTAGDYDAAGTTYGPWVRHQVARDAAPRVRR